MTIKRVAVLLLISAAALFTSCSGGGSGSDMQPSTDWDSMIWDQGHWE